MFSRPKIKDLQGHKDTIHSIAFHPESRRYITGSKDRSLRLWIEEKSTYLGSHQNGINQVDWIQDQVVALSREGVRLWDITQRTSRLVVEDAVDMCVSSHGFAILDSMDRITQWDLRQKDPCSTYTSDVGIQRIVYGPQDTLFLTTQQGSIRILGSQIGDLPAHSSSCTCIAMDAIGRSFVTGGTDAVVLQWDTESLLPQQSYIQHE
jgi:WD40 repeat protein